MTGGIKPRLSRRHLVFQLHYCRAVAAFVVRGRSHGGHERMRPEERSKRVAQTAGSVAVDNPQPPFISHDCIVEDLFHFVQGVVHGGADENDVTRWRRDRGGGPRGEARSRSPDPILGWRRDGTSLPEV